MQSKEQAEESADWVEKVREALASSNGRVNPSGFEMSNIRHASEISKAEWDSFPVWDASKLRRVLVDPGVNVDPSGLSICGVRIKGHLALDDLEIAYPLAFTLVQFEEAPTLTGFISTSLHFRRCLFVAGANLNYSHIRDLLELTESVTLGPVTLDYATVAHIDAHKFKALILRPEKSPDQSTAYVGVSLRHTKVTGNAVFTSTSLEDGLVAVGTDVAGRLDLSHATQISCCGDHLCSDESHEALSMHGARFQTGLFMNNARFRGRVIARRVTIGGGVEATRLHVSRRGQPTEVLLEVSGSTVAGALRLPKATIEGGIDISDSTITNVALQGAHISPDGGTAIAAIRLTCGGDFGLTGVVTNGDVVVERATVGGVLNVNWARLGGSLSLSGSVIHSVAAHHIVVVARNSEGAINFSQTQISSSLKMSLTEVVGRINFSGAQADGVIEIGSAPPEFGPQRPPSPSIQGDFLLDSFSSAHSALSLGRLRIYGNISLKSASIPGGLSVENVVLLPWVPTPSDATWRPPNRRHRRITLDGANIGAVQLPHSRTAGLRHEVSLDEASIASLVLPVAARSPFLWRLVPPRLYKSIRVLPQRLTRGFRHASKLLDGPAKSRAYSRGYRLDNPYLLRLSDTRSFTVGSLTFRPVPNLAEVRLHRYEVVSAGLLPLKRRGDDGIISLKYVRREGASSRSRSSRRYRANGWSPAPPRRNLATRDHADELRTIESWLNGVKLDGSQEFRPQPWFAVADGLERSGHESSARRLRFVATDSFKKERRTGFGKASRIATKVTVGHGYLPWLAAVWLFGLWGVACLLGLTFQGSFTATDRETAIDTTSAAVSSAVAELRLNDSGELAIVPLTKPVDEINTASSDPAPAAYPRFDAALYAADMVLPVLDSGQSAAWRVTADPWLPWVFTVLRMFAWALLGLFVSGVAGIFRVRSAGV